MIAIVDLGIGNFSNVAKAVDGKVTADQYEIEKAEKIVLPGVGSFHTVASELERLRGVLLDRISEGIPVLGICLGMQVLTEDSEEGSGKGLGVIPGRTVRLTGKRLPHIGWNSVRFKKSQCLFEDIDDNSYFYFVHTYRIDVPEEFIQAYSEHDAEIFPAAIKKDNIYGVQFHPEKSGENGKKLLRNFSKMGV